MICSDVLNNLELYIKDELDDKIKKQIEEHLASCPKCMKASLEMKKTIANIKKAYDNISIPSQLDNLEVLLPVRHKKKKVLSRKWLTIASIFILVFIIAVSPIMANIVQNIPLFENYLSHDKGIVNSLEKGFGQQVEKYDETRGVKLTVHNVITDKNRTVVIFSLKLPDDENYDYGQIQRAFLTNNFGKEVKSSGYSYRFDKKTNTITGKFEAEELGFWDNKLEFNIKGLKLTKEKRIPIDIKLNNDNGEISTDIEGIETLTVNRFETEDENGILQYTVILKDKSYNYLNPRIELYAKGERINTFLESGRAYDKKNEDFMTFNLEGLDADNIEAILEVNSLETNIENEWKVSFKVDKDLAQNSTIVKEINKNINLDGKDIIIEKMVITPSQTQIYVKKSLSKAKPLKAGFNEGHTIRYIMDEIRLVTSDKELYMKGSSMESHDGDYQVTVYKFDPITTQLEDIKLVFGKTRKIIHQKNPIFLNYISNKEKFKSVKIGDYILDLKYKMVKGDLVITVDTKDKAFDMVNGAYITINGEKKFADEIITSLVGYERRKGNQTTITFKNYTDIKANFNISAYSIFIDEKYEVQLVK